MTTDPWKKLPIDLPTDGQTVYVRIHYPSYPFVATWDLASGTFADVVTPSLIIPWYAAVRWKPYP